MKGRALVITLVAFAIVAPSLLGKPHKGRKKAAAQEEAPPPPVASQAASARLAQFTTAHLDRILAPLDQEATFPRAELSQLRATLLDDRAKAPHSQKATYQTAVAVCDAISQAMDEREKFTSNAQASGNTPAVEDVHDAKVSLPRRGRGSGRAARAALHKQEYEDQQHQTQTARKSAVLSTNYQKQWTGRSITLRQSIQDLSDRQRDAERAAQQAKVTATPPPAPATEPN